MSTSVFEEQLLHAPDVCSNCFGVTWEERAIVPPHEQKRNRNYPTTKYARKRSTTTVEHVPTGCPTNAQTIFCHCGCTSSYDRYRSEIVGGERFRELLKNAIQTVESKDVTLSREHAIRRAMKLGFASDTTFPIYTVDKAIAEGIKFGVEVAFRSTSTTAVPAD